MAFTTLEASLCLYLYLCARTLFWNSIFIVDYAWLIVQDTLPSLPTSLERLNINIPVPGFHRKIAKNSFRFLLILIHSLSCTPKQKSKEFANQRFRVSRTTQQRLKLKSVFYVITFAFARDNQHMQQSETASPADLTSSTEIVNLCEQLYF